MIIKCPWVRAQTHTVLIGHQNRLWVPQRAVFITLTIAVVPFSWQNWFVWRQNWVHYPQMHWLFLLWPRVVRWFSPQYHSLYVFGKPVSVRLTLSIQINVISSCRKRICPYLSFPFSPQCSGQWPPFLITCHIKCNFSSRPVSDLLHTETASWNTLKHCCTKVESFENS